MAILTFNGESYTVDHAVKGADYIHGYDEDSVMIVSFEGVTDFSGFTYDGTYMEPGHCLAESCNDLKYVNGALFKADGTVLTHADLGVVAPSSVVMATLSAANWSGDAAPYTYALTVSGVTATSHQELLPAVDITTDQLEALQAANIQDGGQAADTITLNAYGDKPTIDLPIRIVKRGD